MKLTEYKTEYKGIQISITEDGLFYFDSSLDEAKVYQSALSMKEIKEEIDKLLKAKSIKTRKVALAMRTSDGTKLVITGINRTSSLLTASSLLTGLKQQYGFLIVDHPKAIKVAKLCDQLLKLREQISIKSSRGYGRIDADKYEAVLVYLEKEYARTLRTAESLPDVEPLSDA